jgi:hypothetical protein
VPRCRAKAAEHFIHSKTIKSRIKRCHESVPRFSSLEQQCRSNTEISLHDVIMEYQPQAQIQFFRKTLDTMMLLLRILVVACPSIIHDSHLQRQLKHQTDRLSMTSFSYECYLSSAAAFFETNFDLAELSLDLSGFIGSKICSLRMGSFDARDEYAF